MAKGSDNDFPSILFTEQAVKPDAPAAGKRRLYFKTDNKLYNEDESGTETEVGGGGAGTDTTAIHDDTSGEIAAIDEKTTLVDDDLFVIEDSEAANAKKRVKKSNLGAAGAPADAKYITSAANGSLSAEVIIPGMAGSADIAGAGGVGTSEEYDTATTGLTWSSAPATVDSNTTILSHLYVVCQADTTERLGTKAWSPAGAFDARCKVMGGYNAAAAVALIGLHIGNSDNSNRLLIQLASTGTAYNIQSYTYASSTYTARGSTHTIGSNQAYLRLTRDGSNNCSFYWSSNGIIWQFIATQALTFTVANIGFRVQATVTATTITAVDWLRTSV